MTAYSKLWHAEQRQPTPAERRGDRPTEPGDMTGFWRIVGAKTKPDYPVAIWREEGKAAVIFQIGRQRPMNTDADRTKFDEFCEASWLKCIAVSYADWTLAMESGRWPDGKPSRQLTTEEKLDIAPASEGGNAPPVEETLADQIATLSEKIEATTEPATQEQVDKLAGDLDRLRGLLKLAEGERVKEKEPHLRASREVDSKWGAITGPGQTAYEGGDKRRKAYLIKEQRRREAEAAAENERRRKEAEEAARIERERVAEETRKRLAEEAEAARLAAAESGQPADAPMTDDEIEQIVAETAAQVEAAPVEEVAPEKARAGSAYGVSRGLRKVKKGEIEDMGKFVLALVAMQHADLLALAQQLANRAAKAGMPVDGMKIVEVEE